MTLLLLIIGLVLFVGLVVVHEFGHFIAAKRDGVDVEEFGIGLPPRAWKRELKSGLLFSINWLPLGGFVRLKGEHDADTGRGTFGAASTITKIEIMAAGVGMNLLVAFVLLTVLACVGLPQLVDNQFTIRRDIRTVKTEVLAGAIMPGSPAARIGLRANDELVGITPASQPGSLRRIASDKTLPVITKSLAGQRVILVYAHDGQTRRAVVQLLSAPVVRASQKTAKPKGYLGIEPVQFTLQRSTWSAPIVALGIMKQFTALTYKGLGVAIKGLGSIIAGAATRNHAAREAGQTQATSQVSGPVGIFVIMKDGSALGYQFLLMIIAVISLTLALINVLPIPVLDGGKVFVTLVARLFKKRVAKQVEDWLYGVSFALLMGLMVVISVVDVKRFILH